MSRSEKQSVLLVDDNEATCTLITAVLHRDFNVEAVGEATEAIERLRTKLYAAVLLDLRMPVNDGFTVLDFLKGHNAVMLRSVLVVTAALSRTEIERARSYGICDIVAKPFDVDTLLNAVRKCAGESGSLGEVFCSSTPMILFLADLLRQRLM